MPTRIQAGQARAQQQLDLAADAGKPVVVHIRDKKGQRDAYDDALTLLRNWCSDHHPAHSPGVLHCFSGDIQSARAALACARW